MVVNFTKDERYRLNSAKAILMYIIIAFTLLTSVISIVPVNAESGIHEITFIYDKAYVVDDHDILGEGHWSFQLYSWGMSDSSGSSESPYRVDDEEHCYFYGEEPTLTVDIYNTRNFDFYAREWDENILTQEWYIDWEAHTSVDIHIGWQATNTWHSSSTPTIDDVSHYYRFYILNLPPTVNPLGPKAGFAYQELEFSAWGLDPEGDSITYEWDFNYDGITFDVMSTEENPTYTYYQSGVYTVAYRVKDYHEEYSNLQTVPVTISVPFIESCDEYGTEKDLYEIGEDIYVKGHGFRPLRYYPVYIVEDVETWTDGMAIPTRVPNTRTSLFSDHGIIPATELWLDPPDFYGKYDVIIDINNNGVYDVGYDAIDDSDIGITAGFSGVDSDEDGLTDSQEILVYGTDPFKADTEGDGFTDYEEVMLYGTDPLDPVNVITSSIVLHRDLLGGPSGSLIVESNAITIDGNSRKITGTGTGNGLTLNGLSDVTIKNLVIEGFENGIFLVDCTNITIEDCTIDNQRRGILVWRTTESIVSGNTFTNCETSGVYLNMANKTHVTGNTLINATSILYGIRGWKAHNNVVEGNTLTDMTSAIGFSGGSTNNVINGNTIDNVVYFGIRLFNDCLFNRIEENTVTHAFTAIPIDFRSNHNNVTGNTLTDNSHFGVVVKESSDNRIIRNIVSNNGHEGIRITSLSERNIVMGNDLSSNYPVGPSQAYDDGLDNLFMINYYDDWTSPDDNGNGFVDIPYAITGTAGNVDPHPWAIIENRVYPGTVITSDFTLTHDLPFCPGTGLIVEGDGITVDGGSYRISGVGTGSGIRLDGCSGVTVSGFLIEGFENGILLEGTVWAIVETNYLLDNTYGVSIGDAGWNLIRNNIITENSIGVAAGPLSYENTIHLNLFMENADQLQDDGVNNRWHDLHLGNFWSNYWGEDTHGRDYIGDTYLPHEGVDEYPLLDPGIPERYGPLLYADWWLSWRGGWSPVEIQLIDPLGRVLSRDVNDIGLNAFYVEDSEFEPGSTKVMVLVTSPYPLNPLPDEIYTFQMTALDDLDYSMTWMVSGRGEVVYERSVEEVPMAAGETKLVETHIVEQPDGSIEVTPVPQYTFGGILQPINPDGSSVFKQGRTIPVKFQLLGDDELPTGTAHATIEVAKITDHIEGYHEEANSTSAANTGNVFRYDPDDEQYIYNLGTEDLDAGTYLIKISLDDGQEFTVQISLR